jgi:hypothetical protein
MLMDIYAETGEGTYMIGSDGIDANNLIAKRGCFVGDELQEVVRGRFSSQEFKLLIHRSAPGRDDAQCDLKNRRMLLFVN